MTPLVKWGPLSFSLGKPVHSSAPVSNPTILWSLSWGTGTRGGWRTPPPPPWMGREVRYSRNTDVYPIQIYWWNKYHFTLWSLSIKSVSCSISPLISWELCLICPSMHSASTEKYRPHLQFYYAQYFHNPYKFRAPYSLPKQISDILCFVTDVWHIPKPTVLDSCEGCNWWMNYHNSSPTGYAVPPCLQERR